ncbi:class I adenylate-forming enzyme family protein [Oceanobacillus saliphilus]|uniref:class I adenylate-forming enzyme family protein n=1 Tax=Oceanobacillus saliphilus TaxID=2925834 RepID=UPI00201E03D3|nr:AMP-binding protein [Oceanobacillus saliphilus]
MNYGNVHSGLRVHAKNKPNEIAVVYGNESLTFRELYHRVSVLANALLDMGVEKGDHIAIYMRNRLEMVEILYAISVSGAVAVPINYMVEGRNLSELVNKSDVKYMFVEIEQLQKFEQTMEQFNEISPTATIVIGSQSDKPFVQYEELIKSYSNIEPQVEVNSNDLFAILFSSGTTSSPKGSMITHGKQIYRTIRSAVFWDITIKDTMLITVPIYHSTGFILVFRTCILGSKIVITRDFNPEKTLQVIEDQQISQSFFVPTQYSRMLQVSSFDQYNLSSLKLLLSAGAPASKELKIQIVNKFKCDFLEFFGSTEAGTYIMLQPDKVLEKASSIGQQISDMEVRLIDEDGNDVKVGEGGEFAIRGPIMFDGYYKLPEEMEKSFITDGWFRTGDMGKMDDDGFYYLLDRKKDMIISGGVNVYPKDIEQVINLHDAVLESAVVGTPDHNWGEVPMAYVVLKKGREISEQEIIEYCNQNLAKYQQIKKLDFLPSLPRNPSGKILKYELRRSPEINVKY